MTLLTLTQMSVNLRGRSVLTDVNLTVSAGEVVGLIGRNGVGKTTLMRAALGLIPASGHSSLADMSANARARAAAWMPQTREIAWPVSVADLVALGRLPHDDNAQAPVEAALAHMALGPLRNRRATNLSGGEQARALIARALAQETPLLMADEPISGLDPAHQIATMEVFAGIAAAGRGVMLTLHDIGLAARHCTRLVILSDGGVLADGPPGEVLTPANLAQAFGISAFHADSPDGPVFQPLRRVT
ncbi:ABC transporter ATP-binding protein [Pseudooceanicola sediminis]|uniref:ABC transporter ATP-binding protein n=1 Tax=Pseudooceanicola sediminis TaxID=2211117 RepID=A0A399IY38_9RHOB|nr:ABC transporter ATP-binding protein [Pseudooceanicola sediminis]RII37894.1 ABC transporter ATP-binding protein [Pseudooceanicola sediminis]|tara:strand:- start:28097 stop:28834 length:738 start_codon:yes stop_codon:yes gene_type:complete